MPGTPVPFRWISGLDTRAQKEIERNFLHIQGQIGGAVLQRNRYYIACSNASADEKAQADIVLDGATDATVLNALTNGTTSTHPNGMDIEFSTGQVSLTATWVISHGVSIRGANRSITTPPNTTATTIAGTGASTNFSSGPTNPVLMDVSQATGFTIELISFSMTGITGATTKNVFFNGSTLCFGQRFSRLTFDASIAAMFLGSASQAITQCVIEHIYSSGAVLLFFAGNSPSGISHSLIFDAVQLTVVQTFVFTTMILYASPSSLTEINSNRIVPQTSMPPNGAAGGRLAGTYPNPTLAASGVTAAAYGAKSGTKTTLTVAADGTVSAASDFEDFSQSFLLN